MNTNLLDQWKLWQYARSLSQRTVTDRIATVTRMAAWNRIDPQDATATHIVTWLAEGGQWSPNTRWTYYASLTAWFAWLQKAGLRLDNPMAVIDSPRRQKGYPHPITDGELRRLLTTRMHARTRAMILLAAFQGLRVHEIAKIKGEHFDLIGRTLTVTGKGQVTAILPLHHRVADMAHTMPKGFWFPGPDNGHQRRESISGTIKEAMIRADVVGSAHWLRHWFGTALVEADVDLRTVQTLMRHANLATTELYTKVSEQRRAEGIDRIGLAA